MSQSPINWRGKQPAKCRRIIGFPVAAADRAAAGLVVAAVLDNRLDK
jgi:hypothetical protein